MHSLLRFCLKAWKDDDSFRTSRIHQVLRLFDAIMVCNTYHLNSFFETGINDGLIIRSFVRKRRWLRVFLQVAIGINL